MSSFLALYRGRSVAEARMVAVSADPALVADFASRLLQQPAEPAEGADDPVITSIERARRKALRLISQESRRGGEG